ncbi:hypothetical protein H696_06134 [Fonticula alba]|uniref:Uncharacterized protein n=1 Tax=Fonticula alba TaxID=691883 RepID=A0A058YZN6_FONAL|nr:hypothetical protein H696_06134 [Fonticula alba]KCV67439.1 hypothetical protein H696_06134 [Fonticula alba]|eukprot:XP_009498166.1 hypothetical protein H696_06134 [Fonticula alba]
MMARLDAAYLHYLNALGYTSDDDPGQVGPDPGPAHSRHNSPRPMTPEPPSLSPGPEEHYLSGPDPYFDMLIRFAKAHRVYLRALADREDAHDAAHAEDGPDHRPGVVPGPQPRPARAGHAAPRRTGPQPIGQNFRVAPPPPPPRREGRQRRVGETWRHAAASYTKKGPLM